MRFYNGTHTNEMAAYYLNEFSDTLITHINPLSRARQIFLVIFQDNGTHKYFAMCVSLSCCKHTLISYTQALSQVSEDGLTIPVMLACLA